MGIVLAENRGRRSLTGWKEPKSHLGRRVALSLSLSLAVPAAVSRPAKGSLEERASLSAAEPQSPDI